MSVFLSSSCNYSTVRHDADSRFHYLGANSPQNIATYGFLLGATFGACVFVLATGSTLYIPFFAYVALLTVFHQLEYVMTALWNRPQLSLDCKLPGEWLL